MCDRKCIFVQSWCESWCKRKLDFFFKMDTHSIIFVVVILYHKMHVPSRLYRTQPKWHPDSCSNLNGGYLLGLAGQKKVKKTRKPLMLNNLITTVKRKTLIPDTPRIQIIKVICTMTYENEYEHGHLAGEAPDDCFLPRTHASPPWSLALTSANKWWHPWLVVHELVLIF